SQRVNAFYGGNKVLTGFIRNLTHRNYLNSGHLMQEVQPLTPIVQFTGNIFDIAFTFSGVSCPSTSRRSFIALISRTGNIVSCRSKMSKRKCLSKEKKSNSSGSG
ncbi:hypothetical protein TNCV_1902561, partial [Trichonephila clavipes]